MKTKLFGAFALSAILFASCNNDDNTPPANDGRVQFTSGVTGIQTRVGGANGDQWDSNDAIGIYMIEHDETLSASSIKEGADNVKYTTASTGTAVAFSSTTPIYYPVNGPLVDFIAYHPYSDTAIEDYGYYWYEIDVQNQNIQSAIDLMTASTDNNGAGYDKTNTSPVNLNFRHQFAKIIINVSAGNGVDNLTGLDVKLKGANHTAIFDLKDFSFVGIGSVAGTVITPYAAGNNRFELILPPTDFADLSDYKVEFAVGGNTYTWTMADNGSGITYFESGRKYTFAVTLTKINVQVSGTIDPWTPVSGGTGIAD